MFSVKTVKSGAWSNRGQGGNGSCYYTHQMISLPLYLSAGTALMRELREKANSPAKECLARRGEERLWPSPHSNCTRVSLHPCCKKPLGAAARKMLLHRRSLAENADSKKTEVCSVRKARTNEPHRAPKRRRDGPNSALLKFYRMQWRVRSRNCQIFFLEKNFPKKRVTRREGPRGFTGCDWVFFSCWLAGDRNSS